MKKIIKSFILMLSLTALVGCNKQTSDGIDGVYKYVSYSMTYTVGGESELSNYISLFQFSNKDDIARKIDKELTSYYDGDRTIDEAIHFTSSGGVTEPFVDGSIGSEYNGNVKQISEYSSTIGFLYGKVNNVYHIYTRYSSISKGNYLDHKRYLEKEVQQFSTNKGTLYDECIIHY